MTTLRYRRTRHAAGGRQTHWSNRPLAPASQAQAAIKDVANQSADASPAGTNGDTSAATPTKQKPPPAALDLQSITLSGKTVTVFSHGDIAITSGQNTTERSTDAANQSHTRTTTQASTLTGQSVTVQGDNVTLSASDITASGAVHISATHQLVMGYAVDSQSERSVRHGSSGGWLNSKKTVDETSVTDIYARTTHISASSIAITAGGDADLYAPELRVVGTGTGTGKAHVKAGGKLNVFALQGEHQVFERHDSSSALFGGLITYQRDNSTHSSSTPTTLVAKLIAPQELHLQSGGSMLLQAPIFDSAKTIFNWGTASRIDPTTGKPQGEGAQLLFEGAKETTLSIKQSTSASLLWQKQTSSVTTDETLTVARFTHPEGVQFQPGSQAGGVVVDVEKTSPGSTPSAATTALVATLQAASTNTGTGTAPSIEQRAIDLTHSHVEKTQEGLTPEGAAVIAIAVAVATGNVGADLLGGTAATSTSSATLFGSTALGTMVNAGYSTLASQTVISLINNQGDISKTLDQLGSEANLKSLATTMLTAGAIHGLGGQISLDVPGPNGTLIATRLNDIKVGSGWAPNLAKNLTNSLASATLNTAINGGDWGANLGHGLTNGLIDTVAQQGAYAIGNTTRDGAVNQTPTQKLDNLVLHTLLGCATGGAKTGNANGCAAGATGALSGDLAARWFDPNNVKGQNAQDFGKVAAGTTNLLLGMDASQINIGAEAAGNAIANNRQLHGQERALAAKLAAASQGKYTQRQIEDALRNSGNTTLGEYVSTGMVTPIKDEGTRYDKGAKWQKGEVGTLIQVLPNGGKVDAELAAFIQANTGAANSPYAWNTGSNTAPARTAWTSNGPVPISSGEQALRHGNFSANGQTYSLPVADCPAAGCTNGTPIARFGISEQDAATVAAYDAAKTKELAKDAMTAGLVLGTAVALPATALGTAAGGGIVGAGSYTANQTIDGKPVNGTELVTETVKGTVIGLTGYGVVKGLGVADDVLSKAATRADDAASAAAEAQAVARARIENNIRADDTMQYVNNTAPKDVPTVVTRNDNDFTATLNHKGNPKAHLDEHGNLIAANPNGTGDVYTHVQGSKPSNTPYISTTDTTLTDTPKNYGSNQVQVDTRELQRDLNSGTVLQDIRILSPQQVQAELQAKVDLAQAKYDLNPSPKNADALKRASEVLGYAVRDGECLIKGCVPAPYLQWPIGVDPFPIK